MPKRANASKLLMITMHDLGSVSKDGVFAPEEEQGEDNLLDRLQCPEADSFLIALRKAFTLTFPDNPYESDTEAIIVEIRKLVSEALLPFAEFLTDLGLSPIQSPAKQEPDFDRSRPIKVSIVVAAIVRASDVDITVKYEGKKRRFLSIIDYHDVDSLFHVARQIVTETFSEVYDTNQRIDLLERIREKLWPVLAQLNGYLDAAGAEPVAMRAQDFPDEEPIVVK